MPQLEKYNPPEEYVRFLRVTHILLPSIAASFVMFAIYLLATHYDKDDTFRAVMALLSALAILVPDYLAYINTRKDIISPTVVGIGGNILALALVLNGIGALGFYRTLDHYDLVLHFINPLFGAWVISIIIASYLRKHRKYSLLRVHFWTALVVTTLMLLWELWEFSGDTFFGTSMFGQVGERFDTELDLAAGMLAICVVILFNQLLLNRILKWINHL